MKKTKYKDKTKYKVGEIILFIITLFFVCSFVFLIILKKILNYSILNLFIIFNIFPVIIFGGLIISILYGKIRTKKREVLIKADIKFTNPYIYYRELPNNFGIGISSILINKTIENEKDIIACILDLCAKKYLKLEKENAEYKITILDSSTSNLLSNEVYVLNHLINNTIQQIDYQKWHQLCVEDGKQLGLFEDNKEVNDNFQHQIITNYYNTNEQQLKKLIPIILLIGAILGSLVFLFPIISAKIANFLGVNCNIELKIVSFIAIMLVSFLLLVSIFGMVRAISITGKTIYQNRNLIYKNTLSTRIIHTAKGIEATKKLYSFVIFLKDFGFFAQKNPEEITLWDEYLSYAIMFNLTNEILKTGYKQLVENASFKIDTVNNIDLKNIKISNFN